MTEQHEPMSQETDLRLIVCPRPLSTTRDRIDVLIPAGATVAEHLRAIGCELDRLSAMVYIDDLLVPKAEWETAVPRAGQSLVLQAVPAGGDDGGKSIIRMVAMIGLIVATWYIGGGGLGAFLPEALGMAFGAGTTASAVLAGAVTIGGALAISALIPFSLPQQSYLPAGTGGGELCSNI
jgi:hypothetical protein